MGSGSAVEMPSDGTEVRGSEGSRKITQGDGGGSSGGDGSGTGGGGGGAGREKVFDFEWNSVSRTFSACNARTKLGG
ncbi:hypothetical protein HZH68_010732 [Vespula germanica]|uniref:Uncharacterized protein n=1 Tax=Vespula germanica TaxID=30212 RepID=A0A834JS81_VESGE|nr:hypothetical protein HZH68_010732 [Vespula germanica]